MLVDSAGVDTLGDMGDSRDSGPMRAAPKSDARLRGRKELTEAAAERTREYVIQLYKKHKNNKASVARALSITPTAVLNILNGGGISRGTAMAVAKAAGISPVELLGEDELTRLGLTSPNFPNLEACIAYHGAAKWPAAAIAAARAGAFADDVPPAAWADRLDRIAAALDAAASSRKN